MYKSDYPTYLVHFNKNHDPKNGQFAEGDGDGDGQINDRKQKRIDKVNAHNAKINEKMENGQYKHGYAGRAKEGDAQGYHQAKTFLDFPYYVNKKGEKYYYDTVFDLPYGERGKTYVQNLGKFLTLPVSYPYNVKTVIDDAKRR